MPSDSKLSTKPTLRNKMTLTYIKNENGHFVCPECNVVKARQNSMHYHMKKHLEERSHVCKSCKKGFLQKQTLDLHVRSKHPELVEEEKTAFACPFDGCTFEAMTKGNCVIHCLRIHFQEQLKERMEVLNDKSIHCKTCSHTFPSSSSFYYHCKKCVSDEKDPLFETLNRIECPESS